MLKHKLSMLRNSHSNLFPDDCSSSSSSSSSSIKTSGFFSTILKPQPKIREKENIGECTKFVWDHYKRRRFLEAVALKSIVNNSSPSDPSSNSTEINSTSDGNNGKPLSLKPTDRIEESDLAEEFAFIAASAAQKKIKLRDHIRQLGSSETEKRINVKDKDRMTAVCIEEKTVMRKGNKEGEVTFRLAMNEDVPRDVLEWLKGVATVMQQFARGDKGEVESEDTLWTLIVEMNQQKIYEDVLKRCFRPPGKKAKTGKLEKEKYIDSLIAKIIPALKRLPDSPNLGGNDVEELPSLDSFSRLCEKVIQQGRQAEVKVLKELLVQCHKFRRSASFKNKLSSLPGPEGPALFRTIQKLGRYRFANQTIIAAVRSRKLQFYHVEVLPVPKFSVYDLNHGIYPASDLLSYLRNILSAWRISTRSRDAFRRMGRRFKDSVVEPPTVHAEIQLVKFYEENPHLPQPTIIGCSKKSCYLCSAFLRLHEKHKIRKTSDKIDNQWTVPNIKCRDVANANKYNAILERMTDELEESLRRTVNLGPNKRTLREVATNLQSFAAPQGLVPNNAGTIAVLTVPSEEEYSTEYDNDDLDELSDLFEPDPPPTLPSIFFPPDDYNYQYQNPAFSRSKFPNFGPHKMPSPPPSLRQMKFSPSYPLREGLKRQDCRLPCFRQETTVEEFFQPPQQPMSPKVLATQTPPSFPKQPSPMPTDPLTPPPEPDSDIDPSSGEWCQDNANYEFDDLQSLLDREELRSRLSNEEPEFLSDDAVTLSSTYPDTTCYPDAQSEGNNDKMTYTKARPDSLTLPNFNFLEQAPATPEISELHHPNSPLLPPLASKSFFDHLQPPAPPVQSRRHCRSRHPISSSSSRTPSYTDISQEASEDSVPAAAALEVEVDSVIQSLKASTSLEKPAKVNKESPDNKLFLLKAKQKEGVEQSKPPTWITLEVDEELLRSRPISRERGQSRSTTRSTSRPVQPRRLLLEHSDSNSAIPQVPLPKGLQQHECGLKSSSKQMSIKELPPQSEFSYQQPPTPHTAHSIGASPTCIREPLPPESEATFLPLKPISASTQGQSWQKTDPQLLSKPSGIGKTKSNKSSPRTSISTISSIIDYIPKKLFSKKKQQKQRLKPISHTTHPNLLFLNAAASASQLNTKSPPTVSTLLTSPSQNSQFPSTSVSNPRPPSPPSPSPPSSHSTSTQMLQQKNPFKTMAAISRTPQINQSPSRSSLSGDIYFHPSDLEDADLDFGPNEDQNGGGDKRHIDDTSLVPRQHTVTSSDSCADFPGKILPRNSSLPEEKAERGGGGFKLTAQLLPLRTPSEISAAGSAYCPRSEVYGPDDPDVNSENYQTRRQEGTELSCEGRQVIKRSQPIKGGDGVVFRVEYYEDEQTEEEILVLDIDFRNAVLRLRIYWGDGGYL